MSTNRDNVAKEIFADAREKTDPAERAAFLEQACRNDAQLRRHVEALLKADKEAGSFLVEPAAPSSVATIVISTPLTEKPGDRIGRYKLLQQIGEGGCGVVYMAEQEAPIRRRVALKVIKLGMDTKAVIARFEAERQALALMDHPNIAKVFDAGATETGRPYFVMELVRGIKITEYCDQHHLATDERLNLFVQICHAIQHAHQKGIIHRDIKPSNILVTVHDGKPLPKIIDFGIAKATSGQALTEKTLFTAFEQFIGTPAYMSPEQAEMSTLDIDTRSDIYALGVLLYELLTGQTPFDQKELVAAGLDEMRRIIREKEPLRPSTRISTLAEADQTSVANRRHSEPPQLIHLVRGDLDWIVMKCLEKDRTRRYETADGLADDVQRHLQDEAVAARPPGRVYRFEKLVRRNKLVFAAGIAVTAALLLGLCFSLWSLSRERQTRMRAVAAELKAQAEANKSQQVAQFLKDMLQGVGPAVAQGRDTMMLREILDKTAERVGKDLHEQPEVQAELRSAIGDVYSALGQYSKAEEMLREAVAVRRALHGNLNADVASSLDSLGLALVCEDKIGEGEAAIQEALTIRTNLLGPEHLAVATSLVHLAEVRCWQYRTRDAEHLFRRSLAIRRKLLGDKHMAVAEALSGLAGVLIDLGKPEEAEIAAREAVAIQASVLPENKRVAPLTRMPGDPQIVLGFVLYREGKQDDRESVLRQQLALDQKVLGLEHPKIVQDLSFLASVLAGEGKLAEAEATARAGLAISRKTFGEDHSTTAGCLFRLGVIVETGGRFAEAVAAYREGLAIWCKLGDVEEIPYASVRLAQVIRIQGQPSEAETLLRAGLESARKSTDPLTSVFLLRNLANFLRDSGRPSDAEPLYREALDVSRNFQTDDVLNFGNSVVLVLDVAGFLRSQGKVAEAESLYRQTLTAGRRLPPSIALAALLAGYGSFLRDEGRFAEAEAPLREGLDIYRKVPSYNLGPRGWLVLSLARVLSSQGKLADAVSLYREALDDMRRLPPSGDLARLLAGYGDILRDDGRLAEAEPLYREGLDICRRVAADDLEGRQWLAAGLADILYDQGRFTESEPLYREAITNSAKVWPNDFKRWELQFGHLVDVLLRQGKPTEVEPLLAGILTLAPEMDTNNIIRWQARTTVLGRRGAWPDAIVTGSNAVQVEPGNLNGYHKLIPILAFTSDTENYRRLCRNFSIRFASTTDPITAEVGARYSLLLPDSGVDLKQVDAWIATAVTTNANELPWFQWTKALVAYRQGRYTNAIDWAQQALAVAGKIPERDASAYLVQAMAQQQLKHPDEARTALTRAIEITQSKLPPPGSGDLGYYWMDWVIAQIMLREAQTLITS